MNRYITTRSGLTETSELFGHVRLAAAIWGSPIAIQPESRPPTTVRTTLALASFFDGAEPGRATVNVKRAAPGVRPPTERTRARTWNVGGPVRPEGLGEARPWPPVQASRTGTAVSAAADARNSRRVRAMPAP